MIQRLQLDCWANEISHLFHLFWKPLKNPEMTKWEQQTKRTNQDKKERTKSKNKKLTELKILGFLFIFQEQWSKATIFLINQISKVWV